MMRSIRKALWFAMLAATLVAASVAQETAAGRAVGTIKTIVVDQITLKTDAGAEINIVVPPATRIVRVAPEHPDLKTAVPAQLQELQAGDRILVRGAASSDGQAMTSSAIVLMKAEDLAQRRERERQDWEKRGVGGTVSAVDTTAGTVQIKTTGFMGSRTVTVRTTKDTIVRRYAPDSPKFDDAVRATLDQVKAGDQLRARGTRNADGSELAAEEIVSGTFRNIAGVVISTDAANNTITLTDLATKKPVTVKVTADSQLHKMPEMLAQRLAFMAKGTATPGGERGAGERPREGERPAAAGQPQAAAGPRSGGFQRNGGAPDLAQMLSHIPAVAIADLQKGEAVMIVATSPQSSSPSIITLLAGVEPILRASPNEGAMLLSPWNVGGGGGGGEGGPPN